MTMEGLELDMVNRAVVIDRSRVSRKRRHRAPLPTPGPRRGGKNVVSLTVRVAGSTLRGGMLVCPECGGTYPVAEGFCPMDGAPLGPAPSRTAEAAQTSDGTPDRAASESQAGMALVGETLDRRYRLDELVGRGGMAFVYRATHTLIGKRIAVKVLRPELHRDPDVVTRFLREAQVVSSIKHPNVIDISDYGEAPGGEAFYIMEFLRGRTLAQRIDEVPGGPLAAEDALGVALQICQGLSAAHEQGVVHRDLKPENVFLCTPKKKQTEPTVKLLDFGIARAGQRITVAGAVLGTPEYMSPEQAQGRDVDHRADLYSLGVILFEMLTGLVPFRSDDVAVTLQSHIHASPPLLDSVDPALAYLRQTQDLLSSMLSKTPDQRPSSSTEVAERLAESMNADLGSETAERVVRGTLAIGSGGIAKGGEALLKRTDPNWGGRMGWNGPGAAPGAAPAPEAVPVAVAGPAPAPPLATTHDLTPRRRGASVPVVMGGAALLAAAVTIGTYAAIGGFDAGAAPSTVEPTSEPILVTAPPVEPDPVDAVPGGERAIAPANVGSPPPPPSPATPTSDVQAPAGEPTPTLDPAADRAPDPTSGESSPNPPHQKRKPTVARSKESSQGNMKKGGTKPTATPKSAPSTPPVSEPPREPPPKPRPKSDPPPTPTVQKPSQSKPSADGPPDVGDLKDPFGRK